MCIYVPSCLLLDYSIYTFRLTSFTCHALRYLSPKNKKHFLFLLRLRLNLFFETTGLEISFVCFPARARSIAYSLSERRILWKSRVHWLIRKSAGLRYQTRLCFKTSSERDEAVDWMERGFSSRNEWSAIVDKIEVGYGWRTLPRYFTQIDWLIDPTNWWWWWSSHLKRDYLWVRRDERATE